MENFEEVKEIGAGISGVARLLRNKKTQELVAVKYIERGPKIDENVKREIMNHRSLCHPNIIRFKEVEMELLRTSIASFTSKKGEIKVEAKEALKEEITKALTASIEDKLDVTKEGWVEVVKKEARQEAQKDEVLIIHTTIVGEDVTSRNQRRRGVHTREGWESLMQENWIQGRGDSFLQSLESRQRPKEESPHPPIRLRGVSNLCR
ncbi:hypothetical protein L7F22_008311 [Adiantum nelumboides]|nr:hypothetical protein [Adiantum nelumboides]